MCASLCLCFAVLEAYESSLAAACLFAHRRLTFLTESLRSRTQHTELHRSQSRICACPFELACCGLLRSVCPCVRPSAWPTVCFRAFVGEPVAVGIGNPLTSNPLSSFPQLYLTIPFVLTIRAAWLTNYRPLRLLSVWHESLFQISRIQLPYLALLFGDFLCLWPLVCVCQRLLDGASMVRVRQVSNK